MPAWAHTTRDAWVDEGADAAGGGLNKSLPDYLGIWVDPEHRRPWHLFSDYPIAHHERFGWTVQALT